MNRTIYDIAKKIGVNASTISRALNKRTKYMVAPDTLKKIEKWAEKLKYTPNITARYLRTKTFNTIGIILPHLPGIFKNDYYVQLLAGVSDVILESDFNFKLVMIKGEKGKWDKYNFKTGEGIDGAIVTHWPLYFSDKYFVKNSPIPFVVISDLEKNMDAHFVSSDDYMGGKISAEYLIRHGHKNIAVLTGPQWSQGSNMRLKGFADTLKNNGIVLNKKLVLDGGFYIEKAFEMTEELLKRSRDFTGIFCLNDEMAVGAIKKLKDHNIKCPEDISVMGFDDKKGIADSEYQLTTVHQPIEEIAREGVKILIDDIKQAKDKKKRVLQRKILPVYIVERKTVISI